MNPTITPEQLRATQIAKQVYLTNRKAPAKQTFNLTNIVDRIKKTRAEQDVLTTEKQRKAEQLKEEYYPAVANKKIAELYNNETDKFILETVKKSLASDLELALENKKENLQKFVSEPPTANEVNLLQMLSLRHGSISPTELEMILPNMKTYQSMTALQELTRAEDGTPMFNLPYDIAANLDSLSFIEERLKAAIENIGNKDNNITIYDSELYYYANSSGKLSQLIAEIDSDFAFADKESVSLYESLKNEVSEATKRFSEKYKGVAENGNEADIQAAKAEYATINESLNFLAKNAEAIKTDADREKAAEAEKIAVTEAAAELAEKLSNVAKPGEETKT